MKKRKNEYRMLAIDLGASGGKIFAGFLKDHSFSMEEIYRFEHGPVSFYIKDMKGKLTERMYWDDIFIWSNILKALNTYRLKFGPQLDSIGIDTWGADGQLFNKDGEQIGKIYAYRDHRLDGMINEIKKKIDPGRIYEITGIHFQPFNLSNQLLWLVMHRKELLGRKVFFLPIPSVFNFYLCGSKAVDYTWASITQLLDARKKQWSKEILHILGIPSDILPQIVKPGTRLGKIYSDIAGTYGINRAIIVAVASHDTASAFAAAPVENKETGLIISSGTWSLVGKIIDRPITDITAMKANLSNEGGVEGIRLLKNCMGTWLVQELRRKWQTIDGKELEWEEIVKMAENAEPFKVFIDPDNHCFYNPADMEEAIINFCKKTGQPPPTSRGEFIRSVYESLALKYRLVNEQICKVTGTVTEVVHIIGGGSKNEMLNQFTANAINAPVKAGPYEATAVGNFMVQMISIGAIKNLKEAKTIISNSFPIKTYTVSDSDSWQKAYSRFRKILKF